MIIDGIAVLSIWVFVWLTMATRESLDVTTAALFISAISALYEVALIARFGQTAGKAVVGIAVVNVSGANPTIRQSVVRYIAKTLQPLAGISRWFRDPSRIVGALITQAWQIVLLVSVATDGRRQGLHDRVAQTWVVNVTLREPFRVRFRAAPGAQAELKIIEQSNIRKRRVRARR